jgi:predicted membrane protein
MYLLHIAVNFLLWVKHLYLLHIAVNFLLGVTFVFIAHCAMCNTYVLLPKENLLRCAINTCFTHKRKFTAM